MIDIDEVKIIFKTMAQIDDDDVDNYFAVIKNAVNVVSNLVDLDYHGDSRAVYLASAKANYDFSLLQFGNDNITSFAAGDVKITKGSNRNSAKLLLDEAMKNAHSIICDNGFAFLGV